MGKKIIIVLAVVFVAATVGIVRLLKPSPGPLYKGTPLSYWLQPYKIRAMMAHAGTFPTVNRDAPTESEAEAAVEALGTNSIPTLLRMIQHRENPLKTWLFHLATKVPFVQIERDAPFDPNREAEMAFKVLGTNGAPAVPQLIDICGREADRDHNNWVFSVLADIGPPAKQAVPMLLQVVAGTNTSLRETALYALGKIHANAAEVVPALISCLRDPDPRGLSAARALQYYGSDAKAAVPALLELIRDSERSKGPVSGFVSRPGTFIRSPTVGETAARALLEIDLDTAMKVGLKPPW